MSIFSRRVIIAGMALPGWLTIRELDPARRGRAKAQGAIVRPENFSKISDTSDSEAINRAIGAAAAAGGGVVQLAARSYRIGAQVQLLSRVTLRGRGVGKTFLQQAGTDESWAKAGIAGGLLGTDTSGQNEAIHIEGLTLRGLYRTPVRDGARFYAKNGISIANACNSSVQNCLVENTGTAIVFHGAVRGVTAHNNLIANCTVRNARSWIGAGVPGTPRGITMATDHSVVRDCSAVDCHTGYYVASEHGSYLRCETAGWSDDGFYVNANHVTLDGCEAIGGAGSGFAVNPSSGHIIRNCIARRCDNAGLRFRHAGRIAPSRNLVESCTFTKCGYGFLDDMTGVDPFPSAVARGNRFIGNLAQECRQSGFLFIRQAQGVIRGNRAIGNNRAGVTLQTRGGISLGEYCIDNVIEDNECDDPGSPPTQLFGLYSYPATITGAAQENRNRIRHRSRSGEDRLG